VGGQVVEEVGPAYRMDVVVVHDAKLVSILRRMSWHFFLTAPGAGLASSRSKSISVWAVTPNSAAERPRLAGGCTEPNCSIRVHSA
jgi:hypothetical protein